ncbi:hypothetical protein LWI29_036643 [Acer saccharum]|uniref:Uncharacterized protein n=1 Tax=Acer saccharum TaxID=4024 RepID=A0AA39VH63_ACESA|nr:hypothetical protein LWI29_036643 [Acer saccharum]
MPEREEAAIDEDGGGGGLECVTTGVRVQKITTQQLQRATFICTCHRSLRLKASHELEQAGESEASCLLDACGCVYQRKTFSPLFLRGRIMYTLLSSFRESIVDE